MIYSTHQCRCSSEKRKNTLKTNSLLGYLVTGNCSDQKIVRIMSSIFDSVFGENLNARIIVAQVEYWGS